VHRQALDFLERMKQQYWDVFKAKRVLELGSLDMNGSPREFFWAPQDYVGVDWREGKGVDEVSMAHEYRGRHDEYFDCVVSTEMLEHDPKWRETLQRAVELLRPGGHIVLTMAGTGRPPHEVGVAPGENPYYENRTIEDIVQHVTSLAHFRMVHAEDNPNPGDSYFLFYCKTKKEGL
jgi:SAM-dependent methyltransferase